MNASTLIVPVVPGSNVEGNIGSCNVQATSAKYDFWNQQTVLTNSCTGEIVSRSVYPDQAVVNLFAYFFLFLVFLVIASVYVSKNYSKWHIGGSI